MTVHIFTRPLQPAYNFVDQNFEPPMRVRRNKRRCARCFKCRNLRWLKNMQVQVYYDAVYHYCRECPK